MNCIITLLFMCSTAVDPVSLLYAVLRCSYILPPVLNISLEEKITLPSGSLQVICLLVTSLS